MTRDELIAALETATEGDWKLDLEIAKHRYPAWEFWIEPAIPAILQGPKLMCRTESGAEEHVDLVRYTQSLDAAVSLIPEGMPWKIGTRDRQAWGMAESEPDIYWCDLPLCDTAARTPALAVCIAAIRARAL